jgi:hypothetical protein
MHQIRAFLHAGSRFVRSSGGRLHSAARANLVITKLRVAAVATVKLLLRFGVCGCFRYVLIRDCALDAALAAGMGTISWRRYCPLQTVVAVGTAQVFRAASVFCAERFPQVEVDVFPDTITVAVRGAAGCSNHRCGL